MMNVPITEAGRPESHGASNPDVPLPTPLPKASEVLKRFVDPWYRLFDWFYGSAANPLYRSGTLAVGFLSVLLITGLYLCFFYSVSEPYESVRALHEESFLGRWMRTTHRYATVATMLALVLHIVQLLVQGKTWGPRILAWLSGVLLTGLFLLSAWSGYVMVWDHHGQKVALAGASLFGVVPMLRDVVAAAFDGTSEVPPGFFFMNLFLHVALPLGMIIFLWVHTARLSRAVWFPRRSILWWWVIGILSLALWWPAPILPEADLTRLIGRIPIDVSTGFWMPSLSTLGVNLTWFWMLGVTTILLTVPWWWRPAREKMRAQSVVDTERCTGCMQCTRDCPYEAIKMVPRADGKRLVAEIITPNCVSCGICAASCDDFAIGPPGRTASDQRERVARLCQELKTHSRLVTSVLISCENNPGLRRVLDEYIQRHPGTILYPVECCGCTHSEVIEQLLTVAAGVVLIGCPARNCMNRDGGDLLFQRVHEKRVPFIDRSIDRNRIHIAAYSEAEAGVLAEELAQFHSRLVSSVYTNRPSGRYARWLRSVLVTGLILFLIGALAQLPVGQDPTHALIRVAGSLASARMEECRMPTAQDLASLPTHMRPKEICERRPRVYQVEVVSDGTLIADQSIGTLDGRTDRPLPIGIDVPVTPGARKIEVTVREAGNVLSRCERVLRLSAGQIVLAHMLRHEERLDCGG